MPRWGNNKIFYPNVINKTLQQITEYEKKTANTVKIQKLKRKVREESVGAS